MTPPARHVRPPENHVPRHERRFEHADCGRRFFPWPWWCGRLVYHYGPCALRRRPLKFIP